MSSRLWRFLGSTSRKLVWQPSLGKLSSCSDRTFAVSKCGLEARTEQSVACRSFSTSNYVRSEGNKPSGVQVPEFPPEELTSSPEPVVVEKIEHLHITAIGINRPHKRNCVNEETSLRLREAFEAFESDENAYVCVLHGLGGNFCSGYDLDELAGLSQDELKQLMAVTMLEAGPMGPTRMRLTKPVIASIEGWCVGGGLELALMCDMRVMDSSAQLGVLNRRFGVPLIDGGSVRLPALIGLSRALDLILTGRIIEAEEAYQMGLVNRLCKPGTAYGRAMHLAKEIMAHPQQCLRVDRNSAYHATFSNKSLEDSLQNEAEHALSVLSHESIVGARKFVNGLGRHGKFNVTPIVEKEEWQKELEQMKAEEATKKSE